MKLYFVRREDDKYLRLRSRTTGLCASTSFEWGVKEAATIFRVRNEAKDAGRYAFGFGFRDPCVEEIDLDAGQEALKILDQLFALYPLHDLCYRIRDNEGKGWDGPIVTAWGDACEQATKLLKERPCSST